VVTAGAHALVHPTSTHTVVSRRNRTDPRTAGNRQVDLPAMEHERDQGSGRRVTRWFAAHPEKSEGKLFRLGFYEGRRLNRQRDARRIFCYQIEARLKDVFPRLKIDAGWPPCDPLKPRAAPADVGTRRSEKELALSCKHE